MSTPVWQITGQDGATLDSATRSLETVGIQDAVLTLQSLEVDTLTWTQTGGIVPDNLQEIHLFRDGVRVFKGTITTRKFSYRGGAVRYVMAASGALYRMSKAQAVAEATDADGTTATRPSVQFAPGDLAESITRLIALAPGVRIGSISPMFNVGRKTFTSGTWLGVLVDMLKPVADVATWVDYSVDPPALHIVRRPYMDALDITLGKDAVEAIELNPRAEAQVTGIALAGASRNASGQVVFQSQIAGDGSQIVAVSGPEIGAFVPPENLPSTTIRTSAYAGRGYAWWALKDAAVAAAIATYGDLLGIMSASDPIDLTGKYEVIEGEVKDFLKTDYGLVESEVHVSGWFPLQYTGAGYGPAGSELLRQGRLVVTDAPAYLAIVYVDVTVPAVSISYPDLVTIYAKGAYEYLQPPSGMAEGMLSAANWLPYEGDVGLGPDFPWQRVMARRLNVLGAQTYDLRTAGALVQTATLRLSSGAIALRCGAPLRTSLASVVSRYQPSGADNIVQI